jgi:hypothetical protein
MKYGCQDYDINRLCRFDRRAIDRSCDGCPRTTDSDYLQAQGLWVAGVSHQEDDRTFSVEEIMKIVEDSEAGETFDSISKRYGVTVNRIAQIVSECRRYYWLNRFLGGTGYDVNCADESKIEWKPIETVPTDTPILITDGKIRWRNNHPCHQQK